MMRMDFGSQYGLPLIALLLAAWAAMPLPAAAQVNDEKYAGYFLVGRFGEVCTMCEVMVLCEAGAAPPAHGAVPPAGSFTLYHIQTRTFWSQVATIWEWFVSNFSPRPLVGGHSRPVIVHQVTDGAWAPPVAGDMHISLEPPLMSMPDGREIDRVGRRWRVASPPTDIGYCERLPLWDALAVIGQQQSGSTAQ
jgi:hypothetical protein